MKKVINIFNFLIFALFIFLIVFTPTIFSYSYTFFSDLNYNMIYKKFNYFTLFIIFILLMRNFSLIILNSKFITNDYIKNLFQQCLFSAKYRWLGFLFFLILDIIIVLINEIIIIKIDFFRFIFFFLYYAFSPAYLLFLLFSSKNNLNITEKTICLLFINLFNNIILLFVIILWAFMGFDP